MIMLPILIPTSSSSSSGLDGELLCGLLFRVLTWLLPTIILCGLSDLMGFNLSPLLIILGIIFVVIGLIHGVIYIELYDKDKKKLKKSKGMN